MVRLREGVPHTQIPHFISVLRENGDVASQRHWIAGNNDDHPGSIPADGTHHLRART
jgi:hypothetical protein